MRTSKMLSCVKNPQLSIYIHIPFCVKKCFYCDFLSAPATSQEIEIYVNALVQEMKIRGKEYQGYHVPTIFIGGGTPSLLSVSQIKQIGNALSKNFSMGEEMEFTIEVNPGTVDESKLQMYKEIGINRLSIGLQSTENEELKAIGRIHTYETFLETYKLARKIGFTNINIDLMSALPGQDEKTYESTVRKICNLFPEHISAYSLIIEEETEFFKRYGEGHKNLEIKKEAKEEYLPLPNEEVERHMYELTEHILKEYGYTRYEISNYSQYGKECKHNIVYWQRGNYLGLGIGAASLVENRRFTNTSDIDEYQSIFPQIENEEINTNFLSKPLYIHNNKGLKDIHVLSKSEQMEEFMFLGLRMMEGVSIQQFNACFEVDINEIFGQVLIELQKEKLIEIEAERGMIYLTPYGIDISNYVLAHFLLEN